MPNSWAWSSGVTGSTTTRYNSTGENVRVNFRSCYSRFLGDCEGSALLEGTVMVPFLCVLVFGALEFSRYFYQQHLISTGVRDAARFLARTPDPTAGTWQDAAKNLAATA